jgi:hypothetical protein
LISLFLDILRPFISSVFHSEMISCIYIYIYILNNVGERGQHCRTPLLIANDFDNFEFNFILISLCSYIFNIAVNSGSSMFLFCNILNNFNPLT